MPLTALSELQVGRMLGALFAGPVVTNLLNEGEGSLRQAIVESNIGDTITFVKDLRGSIALKSELVIDKDLTIVGPGAGALTLDGGNSVRIVSIREDAVVTLSGLAFANGLARGNTKGNAAGVGSPAFGGAVYCGRDTRLTVAGCAFTGNVAEGGKGKIAQGAAYGGGIYSDGIRVNVMKCRISRNSVSGTGASGGAVYAREVEITNSSISGNAAQFGGGVYTVAALKAVKSSISDNVAETKGGGIYCGTALKLCNCAITDNIAGEAGGGVFLTGSGEDAILQTNVVAHNIAASGEDIFTLFDLSSEGFNFLGSEPVSDFGEFDSSPSDVIGRDAIAAFKRSTRLLMIGDSPSMATLRRRMAMRGRPHAVQMALEEEEKKAQARISARDFRKLRVTAGVEQAHS